MKTKLKNILFILTIIFAGFTFQSWTTITYDGIHEETIDIIDLESNLNSENNLDCDYATYTITYNSILTFNEKKAIRMRNAVQSYTVINGYTEIWVVCVIGTGNEGGAVIEEDPEIIDAEPIED